jgi:Ser/Thr protein kinase RdoA (MazF antagonist)
MAMTDGEARVAAGHWLAPGAEAALEPLGDGHINDTWLMTSGGRQAVLQRINARVFPEPRALMIKVAAVVGHLPRPGAAAPDKVAVPGLLPTAAGTLWHEAADGGIWRLWQYVGGTRCLTRLRSPAEAETAGRAFGNLQRALADLPGEVPDPIPGFMQLDHYLTLLDRALAVWDPGPDAAPAVAAVAARRDLAGAFANRDRLIHGDCKVDNVLFDDRCDEVVCIIDLDTVMRGHWGWDFGDLVRSAAAEPPSSGAGAGFSVERFAVAARGFVGSGAAPRDVAALVLAPRYVALMLAVRFLTDHLEGDRYFKVARPGDNLQRALAQLELVCAMEARERAMRVVASAA